MTVKASAVCGYFGPILGTGETFLGYGASWEPAFPLVARQVGAAAPRILPTSGLVEVPLVSRPLKWSFKSRPPLDCRLAAECPAPALSASRFFQSQPAGTAPAWSGLSSRSATV